MQLPPDAWHSAAQATAREVMQRMQLRPTDVQLNQLVTLMERFTRATKSTEGLATNSAAMVLSELRFTATALPSIRQCLECEQELDVKPARRTGEKWFYQPYKAGVQVQKGGRGTSCYKI